MGRKSYVYDGSLGGLFALLGRALADGESPARVTRAAAPSGMVSDGIGDLFPDGASLLTMDRSGTVRATTTEAVEVEGIVTEESGGGRAAELALASSSALARMDFIYAWMSELPVERDAIAFALRVILSGWAAQEQGADRDEVRRAAEIARSDRGDAAVRATLAAGQKVMREAHRLQGLLRFSEGADGRLIALCACDHAVLPALAEHFSARFGERPWAIVDERRRVALIRDPPGEPRMVASDGVASALAAERSRDSAGDEWEELWRGYHRAVAIDSRANPALQRRLMPVRYWKYLTELQ